MKVIAGHKLTTLLALLVAGILVLLPFHAVLTVWAGSTFGGYDWWRLWKELLLVGVAVPLAKWLVWRDKDKTTGRWYWQSDTFWWLVAGYVLLQLGLGLWAWAAGRVTVAALTIGWIIDVRFLLFMAMCMAAAQYAPWLRTHWRQLLLVPAVIVLAFGLLQIFVLPADVLQHAGYGPTTIEPFQTVDQKAAYVRVQSTLRGPNPLGAYLVVILVAAVALLAGKQDRARRGWLVALVVASLVVLWWTYSRSAYIGAALACGALGWLLFHERARRWLLVGIALAVLVTGSLFAMLRDNDRFQNAFFHTDEHSTSADSSNHDRLSALRSGLHDVAHEPLGRGPGTAGPASVHNDGRTRLAENYYLQIGQEVGWAGLVLFVAINVIVAWRLWQRRHDTLAAVLLCSLVGLTFINMVSHAWADDTLGMLWWGLAGIALARQIKPERQAKV